MGPLGTDKALLTYRGRTFLETVISTLRHAEASPIIVVLGHHAEDIQRAVDLTGVEIVVNREYRRGQTSSLQAGLRALNGRDGAAIEGVILCLVDHPAVSAGTVRLLALSLRASGAPVVIPTYAGKRGHPVLIGNALFGELLGLSPDLGANEVLRKYRESTQFVEVDDAGILVDVDDPASYQNLIQPES
jgi:molybdenum cofactor cytidylyltransferase